MADAAAGLVNAKPQCFAFVFPGASGHINPSLPIARQLVKLGHQVHYLSREPMRAAIEDTGATFHLDIDNEPELYCGREPEIIGALADLKKEHGMENESAMAAFLKIQEIMIELMLPGVIRWLRWLKADAVVYCPMLNLEAALAAKSIGLPAIAILTTAGAGSWAQMIEDMLRVQGLTACDVLAARRSYKPLQDCIARLNEEYGLDLKMEGALDPVGRLEALVKSSITLVTTCRALEDPVHEDLAKDYADAGVRFEAVGPLLDVQGARRAATHKLSSCAEHAASTAHDETLDPLALLEQAKRIGRKVVLVSMGTVITGDSNDFGWDARLIGPDGRPQGLSGRELCRAAWGGMFDAFGTVDSEEAPLLLVAVGPQADPLGDLEVPYNAVCLPSLPQVDLLKAGVDLFLTHGGQNSFMEALYTGTPVVVCPGFADQPANAQKAEDIGAGLQVKRPVPAIGQEFMAAAAYRREVRQAACRVLAESTFGENAARCADQLKQAGGVPRAVSLLLSVAAPEKVLPSDGAAKAHIAGA